MASPVPSEGPAAQNWVNFSLGEDVRDERRQEQDRLWSKAVADGRSHFSHREFALEYGQQFRGAIDNFTIVKLLLDGTYCKQSLLHKIDEMLVHIIVEYALPGQSALVPAMMYQREMRPYVTQFFQQKASAEARIRICLRPRPLLMEEQAMGCYDIARIVDAHEVILHEGKLARNGRLLSMTHHRMLFDRVYDPRTSNERICADAIQPLMDWAMEGKRATLLCFGQTGTGKTYTLYGALRYLATLWVNLTLSVTFYEVHGNKCYDLLNHRQLVHLRFDENEEVHVRGACVAVVPAWSPPSTLLHLLESALSLRSSLRTERNPISSRSHAVCRIDLKAEGEGRGGAQGRLTLVDLAGSERNTDTSSMSAAQHKESADINLALMALKECFRAQALGVRVPYRASPLTKVLKDCFSSNTSSCTSSEAHSTTIMATVSPSPLDLAHSLNTSSHVLLMSPRLPAPLPLATVSVPKHACMAPRGLPVGQWTPPQVCAWLSEVERGRFAHLSLPAQLDGRGLLALSPGNLADLFEKAEAAGRGATEGPAWVVSVEDSSKMRAIAAALHNAIHREALLYAPLDKGEAEAEGALQGVPLPLPLPVQGGVGPLK